MLDRGDALVLLLGSKKRKKNGVRDEQHVARLAPFVNFRQLQRGWLGDYFLIKFSPNHTPRSTFAGPRHGTSSLLSPYALTLDEVFPLP